MADQDKADKALVAEHEGPEKVPTEHEGPEKVPTEHEGPENTSVGEDGEDCVNMVEVLEEEQKLEEDANAVLGDSDDKHCTYPKGCMPRQALYSCVTCGDPDKSPAGVCLACCLECHEGHELYELYTKRNFTCDCGNTKFVDKKCKLCPEKSAINEQNEYNQNFRGLYCTCHRPYPDPEDTVEDAMIQCVICEDWYHGRHLKVSPPGDNNYEELTCFRCVEKHSFLMYYRHLQVLTDPGDCVQIQTDNTHSDVEVTATSPHTLSHLTSSKQSANDDLANLPTVTGSEHGGDTGASSKDNVESAVKETGETGTDANKSKSSGENDSMVVESEHKQTIDAEKPGVSVVHQGASSSLCKLSELDSHSQPTKCTSLYWKSGWRKHLCLCTTCKKMYKEQNIPFITDVSDTITMYEARGRHKHGSFSTRYERGLEALSQMNRVQQVEMLHGYNDLQSELKEYLKKFADNGKVVKEEDIKEFFSGLASRKKQKVDMSYFCK